MPLASVALLIRGVRGLAGGYRAAVFTLGEECDTDVRCVDLAVGLHSHLAQTWTVSVLTCVTILNSNGFFNMVLLSFCAVYEDMIYLVVACQDLLLNSDT